MIECVCDRCTKVAGSEAYYLTITEISNKSRYSIGAATVTPKIESGRQGSIILCQSCYNKLGLPTIDELNEKDDRKWEGSNG